MFSFGGLYPLQVKKDYLEIVFQIEAYQVYSLNYSLFYLHTYSVFSLLPNKLWIYKR